MTANEGAADRVVRVVLGIVLGVVAWMYLGLPEASVLGIVAVVVGAVLLVTGLVGFCPCYPLCKINTCKVKSPPETPA